MAVYVHGLWMPGPEGTWLARRLAAQCGCRVLTFHYHSVLAPPTHVVAALHETLASLQAARIHLIGHSMGGVIVLRCLERYGLSAPGRVVFLGTPVAGSCAARALGRTRAGRWLLGRTAGEELLGTQRHRWTQPRELGVIAGTLPIGSGRLLVRFHEPNDGIVTVSETRIEGAKDCLCVPVTHTGLLLSPRVASAVGNFLESGRFEGGPPPAQGSSGRSLRSS